jgi:hypothetical protein
MTIDLTDTSTGAIHEALTQARRRMGGPASGTVLTPSGPPARRAASTRAGSSP